MIKIWCSDCNGTRHRFTNGVYGDCPSCNAKGYIETDKDKYTAEQFKLLALGTCIDGIMKSYGGVYVRHNPNEPDIKVGSIEEILENFDFGIDIE